METERELDLKDLMYWALKRWRSILAGAIIIALLAGIYQTYRGLGTLRGDGDATASQAYASELAEYQSTEKQLQENITRLQSQLVSQLEYNEKSLLMKIDPMNKWVSSVQFYIDAGDAEQSKRLIATYAGLLSGGDMYEKLMAQCPDIAEARFLTEVYDVTADPGAGTVTVRCVGSSEQTVRQMTEAVKSEMAAKNASLRSSIGEHMIEVLTETVYAAVDSELEKAQKENLLAAAEYTDKITEAKETLNEWKKERPQAPATRNSTIKGIVKYVILGFVLGAVLMCVWYAVKYALSDSLKTDEVLRRYQLPVLGRIVREQQKKKFLPGLDALLDRIFGRTCRTTTEQSCALAAQSLGAALKKQGLTEATLVGQLPENLAETLIRQMNAAETGVRFRCAGDALTDPAAARALEGSDKVLLLAERYATPCGDLEQTLTLLTAWGKSALGAVVVE